MFCFDKKQVTISLKYLGGHPELPKQRTLTAFRRNGIILFKEVSRPIIPVQSIKKIALRKVDSGRGTITAASVDPKLFQTTQKIKNVLVITVDYNGLDVQLVFTSNNITAKYAQFMGLLKGSYKEYEQSEGCSS